MAITEARAAHKEAGDGSIVKVNYITSIKTMLRDEDLYRRQRHKNFLFLYNSKTGRKWLRIYFVVSCPLPIALGVCLALVKSSLMLIGLLVFSGSLLSFGFSLVSAIKELVDATRAFESRKHSATNSPDEETQSEQLPEVELEEVAHASQEDVKMAFGGGDAVVGGRVGGMDGTSASYDARDRQGRARKRLANWRTKIEWLR